MSVLQHLDPNHNYIGHNYVRCAATLICELNFDIDPPNLPISEKYATNVPKSIFSKSRRIKP